MINIFILLNAMFLNGVKTSSITYFGIHIKLKQNFFKVKLFDNKVKTFSNLELTIVQNHDKVLYKF